MASTSWKASRSRTSRCRAAAPKQNTYQNSSNETSNWRIQQPVHVFGQWIRLPASWIQWTLEETAPCGRDAQTPSLSSRNDRTKKCLRIPPQIWFLSQHTDALLSLGPQSYRPKQDTYSTQRNISRCWQSKGPWSLTPWVFLTAITKFTTARHGFP